MFTFSVLFVVINGSKYTVPLLEGMLNIKVATCILTNQGTIVFYYLNKTQCLTMCCILWSNRVHSGLHTICVEYSCGLYVWSYKESQNEGVLLLDVFVIWYTVILYKTSWKLSYYTECSNSNTGTLPWLLLEIKPCLWLIQVGDNVNYLGCYNHEGTT